MVAPATADLLAKAAHGLADDLLTNTLLTARCPVVFAPAMHTEMWEHPATQANVATLRSRGAVVIEPAEGRLTGADTGKGRLPDPGEIFALATDLLARRGEHGGARPGPGRAGASWSPPAAPASTSTRCASSATAPRGCQGYALARTAAARGAEVTLVAANVTLPDPAGVKVVRVETTAQLQEHVLEACASADAVVMAAAPGRLPPGRAPRSPRSRSPRTVSAPRSG